MSGNIELTDQAKKACADALFKALSDTFVLYLKTHNFHWNVVGPQFVSLHKLFEDQYQDLWNTLDEMAERIRALGQPVDGTAESFKKAAEIKQTDARPAAKDMLKELVADNETAVRTIRAAFSTVDEAGDEASADLLTDRLSYHEKQIWMMKSLLEA